MKKLFYMLLFPIVLSAQDFPFRSGIFPATTNTYDLGNWNHQWDSLFVRYAKVVNVRASGFMEIINTNDPYILIGDANTGGVYGFMQWISATDYLRLSTGGATVVLKIQDVGGPTTFGGTIRSADTIRSGNYTTYSYFVPGGDLVKSSDSTLKENIRFCSINLNNFKNVSPRTFNFIGSTNNITGFLAQEFNSQLFGRTSTEISNSEITAALWEKVKQVDSTVQAQVPTPSGSVDSTIWMKKWREELYTPLTDPRLTDARTPLTHTHAESQITNLVTDLAGKQATLTRNTGAIVYAALANGTTAMDFGTNSTVKVTPTATATYTTTVPAAGCEARLIILTSGTTSRTITFGAGFRSTGTLATGTATGKVFVLNFISDGTVLLESTARTVAH